MRKCTVKICAVLSILCGLLLWLRQCKNMISRPPHAAKESVVVRSADSTATTAPVYGNIRAIVQTDDRTSHIKFVWIENGQALSYADVIKAWREFPQFGSWFSSLLAAAPFREMFWECPPTTSVLASRMPFECTLIRTHGFRGAAPTDFAEYIRCSKEASHFPNLGRDAVLIAPCEDPDVPRDTYAHLAAFCRGASAEQLDAFWRQTGNSLSTILGQRGRRPTWLSTAGSGVPWLHVRLDSRPKYYKTDAYRDFLMSEE